MSQYNVGPSKTFAAGADLSAAGNEAKIVKLSSGTIVLGAAITDLVIGVLEPGQRPKSGEQASVRLLNSPGTVKVQAGAAVTRGAEVTCDATGRAIDVVGTTGTKVIGIALEAAGAAGVFIEVLLLPRTIQ